MFRDGSKFPASPMMKHSVSVLLLLLGCCGSSAAEDISRAVQAAVERGLALTSRAGTNWQSNQTCFACHHHTLPMLAMQEATKAGSAFDPVWMKSQGDHVHAYFKKRTASMEAGKHVPGGAASVGYGLWALSLDQRAADATTTAMVSNLLQIQGRVKLEDDPSAEAKPPRDGRWIASCRRAPLQGSEIGDTVLVLIGLEHYATEEQRPKLAVARRAAERFLEEATLENQQDRLWRLWGLHRLGGDPNIKRTVRNLIIQAQRADGGWSHTDGQESDAYSTGQTLFMLCQTEVGPDRAAVTRARDYLLKTQRPDGSWLVESWVKYKAQTYFDNGDPHGENQFLSTAATAWAIAGLSQPIP